MAGADQFEQHARLGLVLGNVGKILEDQQDEAVKPADGGLQATFVPGKLQFVDEVCGAGGQHFEADRTRASQIHGGEVALPAAGGSNSSRLAPCASQASSAATAMT